MIPSFRKFRMNLSQLECPLDKSVAESLSLLLEDQAVSISWYEKEFQEWHIQVIYNPQNEENLKNTVNHFFKEKGIPLPQITTAPLPQEDWVTAVYQGFSPLTLGKFYIYGSHIQEGIPHNLIPLQIDAATAFGSGQHESTEGCLKALSFLSENQDFKLPLDMGCGSGILALAMASLWKVPVLACDNDPEAVRVTLENAQVNNVPYLIEARVSEGFTAIKGKMFDIITANILAGPLCQMAGDVIASLIPGGFVVLAGLLNRQAEDVIDAYRSVGARLVHQLFVGDWSTLVMRKENHE